MKKFLLIILAFSGLVLALTDTDSDGISDDKDICPRVYARSETGCPTLTVSSVNLSLNSCLTAQLKKGKVINTVTPICDKSVCPQISKVVGFQPCDPIFPIIFDTKWNPLIRGSVFIVDYTH